MPKSLESICEEFGLQKNLSKTKLRAELKKLIASIHADKTGGEFPNEAVKQLYLRMQEALDHLDGQKKVTALQRTNSGGKGIESRVGALEAMIYLGNSPYEESARHASESAGRQYRRGWISSGV